MLLVPSFRRQKCAAAVDSCAEAAYGVNLIGLTDLLRYKPFGCRLSLTFQSPPPHKGRGPSESLGNVSEQRIASTHSLESERLSAQICTEKTALKLFICYSTPIGVELCSFCVYFVLFPHWLLKTYILIL